MTWYFESYLNFILLDHLWNHTAYCMVRVKSGFPLSLLWHLGEEKHLTITPQVICTHTDMQSHSGDKNIHVLIMDTYSSIFLTIITYVRISSLSQSNNPHWDMFSLFLFFAILVKTFSPKCLGTSLKSSEPWFLYYNMFWLVTSSFLLNLL